MAGRCKKYLSPIILVIVAYLLLSVDTIAGVGTTFVMGTKINGVSVSGLTIEEAKERIEASYDEQYQLTILGRDGKREIIKGSEIGYNVASGELVPILEAQNAAGRVYGPAIDHSYEVGMASTYHEEVLIQRLRSLSAVSGDFVVKTKDAFITPYVKGQAFSIIPEVYGDSLDFQKLLLAVKGVLDVGGKEVDLEQSGCYEVVTITSENPELVELSKLMNQCREMEITYIFGEEKEILPSFVIVSWITGIENGMIQINRDAALAYIDSLAEKYDTAGKKRTFRSSSGREVFVSGSYGWKMNREREVDALIGMIRTGQTQSREPEYVSKGAARNGLDWGSTYVEIDLKEQHVYLVRDGVKVWDAPCVTGNVSKGHTTPEGIYSLYYKERNRVLRGKKQADGTYEYESPVKYWMPFNGGIGLHDADWRSQFGETIYKKNGSHGCINLPPSKTKELYDSIYPGIPVICYN